jgi:branched-subunit amino acid aminotransferase/4-amino-4-deoxychorismate lyase
MNTAPYFCYNGKLLRTGKLIISADNRSFRYGDGFFETMKMIDGSIVLNNYHFERLFSSLYILKFEKPSYFTDAYLEEQIKNLAAKNNHRQLARLRLTIFRGDGGLYDCENHAPNYIIQTWELDEQVLQLNENGLVTDIYKDAKKCCDAFSHIKSNNYLPYTMAALWAKENKLNDAFLLNNFNRLADATIANIFIVKDGKVKTPALSEGCVGGVMRRYLLTCMRKENIPVEEIKIEDEEVYEANEIFLTNSVYGIRWIKQCGKNNYHLQLARYLHENFIKTEDPFTLHPDGFSSPL